MGDVNLSKGVVTRSDITSDFRSTLSEINQDADKERAWNGLREHLKELDKPRNVLLLGSYGAGKSSLVNTFIEALTGEKYKYYASVGSGDKHCSIRLQLIPRREYWKPKKEEDKDLNLPNFIDIIGLDIQLSNPNEKNTVNRQIMNLLICGKLPENCDLLDLGKNLKEGKRIKEGPDKGNLAVDVIIVVISAEDFKIPYTLLDEVYEEANVKSKQVPVFCVVTKTDKIDLSEEGLKKSEEELTKAMCIAEDKILLCKNYQAEKESDIETDVRILEFLTKICDPSCKAFKRKKVEFEENYETTPSFTNRNKSQSAPTTQPIDLSTSVLGAVFIAVLALLIWLIYDILKRL